MFMQNIVNCNNNNNIIIDNSINNIIINNNNNFNNNNNWVFLVQIIAERTAYGPVTVVTGVKLALTGYSLK